MFVGLLGDEELATCVDIEDAVEVGGGNFIDGAKVLETFTTNGQTGWLHPMWATYQNLT